MARLVVRRRIALWWLLALLGISTLSRSVTAFRATPILLSRKTAFLAAPSHRPRRSPRSNTPNTASTGLRMFMGSDGGLLGVGTPEVFTVLLVGYFVLGPSDLYKLVKEIGKFVQNIRSLGTDLTTTFENNLESQLQLEDIRKAQRELNDAFSFRRSINTQADEEAFTTTVTTPREPTVQDEIAASVTVSEATASAVEGGAPKRKIRRRVKKKAPPLTSDSTGVIPDLEMPLSTTTDSDATVNKYANRPTDPFITTYTPEEEAIIDQEFDAYTSMADGPAGLSTASSSNNSSSSLFNETMSAVDPAADASAQSRFQEQLSGNWNDQILANQDKLAPLAKVMEMLAVLEDEKIASTKRLEEEFRRRAELDEGYYQKQRKLLEEAASQVQTEASK